MTIELKLLLLAAMFWCHILDDYVLQNCLASLKQRRWWINNSPDKLYRNDYKMALWEHAFSWSFTMTLPLFITSFIIQNYKVMIILFFFYIVNTIIHALIDNMKANKHKINLIQDQLYHFAQILFTWIIIAPII